MSCHSRLPPPFLRLNLTFHRGDNASPRPVRRDCKKRTVIRRPCCCITLFAARAWCCLGGSILCTAVPSSSLLPALLLLAAAWCFLVLYYCCRINTAVTLTTPPKYICINQHGPQTAAALGFDLTPEKKLVVVRQQLAPAATWCCLNAPCQPPVAQLQPSSRKECLT